MSYQVVIPKPVEKQLDGLPEAVLKAVLLKLSTLKETPRPHGCVKLKGYDEEYRLRVGDYLVDHHKNGKRLEKKVHDIPKQQDEEIARLKLQTMGISIDKLSRDQEEYIESYSEGT